MRVTTDLIIILAIASLGDARKHLRRLDPDPVPPRVIPAEDADYEELSAEFWRWLYGIDIGKGKNPKHPGVDAKGTLCNMDQPLDDVWIAIGAFTSEVAVNDYTNTIVREKCKIDYGKKLLIPIVNADCQTIGNEPFKLYLQGENENVETCANNLFGGWADVKDLSLTIDGVDLSDDLVFVSTDLYTVDFADNNLSGKDCDTLDCEDVYSVSAGWYALVDTLPKGEHVIHFTGTFYLTDSGENIFALDVAYDPLIIR